MTNIGEPEDPGTSARQDQPYFYSAEHPTQPFPVQQYPAQQYPTQQYPAQQYPTQQYPAQYGTQFYGQPYPSQPPYNASPSDLARRSDLYTSLRREQRRRTWGWVGGGVLALAVLVGGATTAIYLHSEKTTTPTAAVAFPSSASVSPSPVPSASPVPTDAPAVTGTGVPYTSAAGKFKATFAQQPTERTTTTSSAGVTENIVTVSVLEPPQLVEVAFVSSVLSGTNQQALNAFITGLSRTLGGTKTLSDTTLQGYPARVIEATNSEQVLDVEVVLVTKQRYYVVMAAPGTSFDSLRASLVIK